MLAFELILVLLIIVLIIVLIQLKQQKKEVMDLLQKIEEHKSEIHYTDNDEYDFGHDVKIIDVDIEE